MAARDGRDRSQRWRAATLGVARPRAIAERHDLVESLRGSRALRAHRPHRVERDPQHLRRRAARRPRRPPLRAVRGPCDAPPRRRPR
ncbi:MAG: hypothetical protein E6J38_01375 [Chloroflexi bacterium]|nr:MAG: hypothetical protein E6J49_12345 [Chloroflexota bacterium]TMB97734.1 MAG: hypothetical protein E6J38_01375 [Chloroflexota bacterium]TMC31547.1 MAG: hypothetical protein E6J27_00070 [Chloroflexota bacterium]TMC36455.1 MAG: hypothetical protein E6J24_02410 [Chloroflexota bacterium]